ncbi:MAG: 4Fe-4S binding protein [Desulfobacterales bacterium]|nr:4Fe-4S binding protein [Desulfobacterales bacterium]
MAFTITDKCVGCAVCTKICPTGAISGKRNKKHRVEALRCIDCGACGRICPHEAILDADKKPCQRIRFRKNWEKPVIDRKKCISCNICIDACPVRCLSKTFTPEPVDKAVYPELVRDRDCIACGICATDCPVGAIVMKAPVE